MKNVEIYNDDCLKIMDELIEKNVKLDLIVTDPPYLVSYKTNHRKNKDHKFCKEILGDSDPNLIKGMISKSYKLLKDNSAMYMFCSMDKVDFFKQELEKYFKIKNMIIWVKNNWTAGDLQAQFGKQYEIVFLVNKGRKLFNGKRLSDVWNFNRVVGKKQLHQNEKPIDLIELMVNKHSKENDLVADFFMGSGTTGVACQNLGRKFIGIEKDRIEFQVAKNRLEENEKILNKPKLELFKQ